VSFEKGCEAQIASSPTHPQAELTSGRFPQKNSSLPIWV
jgi:hypothetical protein